MRVEIWTKNHRNKYPGDVVPGSAFTLDAVFQTVGTFDAALTFAPGPDTFTLDAVFQGVGTLDSSIGFVTGTETSNLDAVFEGVGAFDAALSFTAGSEPPGMVFPTVVLYAQPGETFVFDAGTDNELSVSDADTAVLTLSLGSNAAGVTFTLASTTGITFNPPSVNGGENIGFYGSIADLNAALDGLAVFVPDPFTGNGFEMNFYASDGTTTLHAAIDFIVRNLFTIDAIFQGVAAFDAALTFAIGPDTFTLDPIFQGVGAFDAALSFSAGGPPPPPTPGTSCSDAPELSYATDYSYTQSGTDQWFKVAVTAPPPMSANNTRLVYTLSSGGAEAIAYSDCPATTQVWDVSSTGNYDYSPSTGYWYVKVLLPPMQSSGTYTLRFEMI